MDHSAAVRRGRGDPDPDRLPCLCWGSLDLDGLDISWADLDLLLTVDTQAWKLEAEHIPEFFRGFHRHLPERLWELHQELVDRLGGAL